MTQDYLLSLTFYRKGGLMRAVDEYEEQRRAVGGVHEQAHLLEAEPEAVVHYLRQRSVHGYCYVRKPSNITKDEMFSKSPPLTMVEVVSSWN